MMPAWVYVLAVCAAAWCVFVGVFHPFRKGAHVAPRALPVAADVYDATVPRAEVAGRPPWLDELYDDDHAPPSGTHDRPYLAWAPDWAAAEAPRWAVGGANSGANGYELGEFDEWQPEPPMPVVPYGFGVNAQLWAALPAEPEPCDHDRLEPSDPCLACGERGPADDPPGRWLDDQLAVLFVWVRDVHAQLAAS